MIYKNGNGNTSKAKDLKKHRDIGDIGLGNIGLI